MFHLDDLWSEVRKERKDVVFYAVNLQAKKSRIEKHWKETGHTLIPVMQQNKQVSRAFGVSAYPTDFVIGPDGKVVYRGTGWNKFERAHALEAAIRASMEGTKAPEGVRLSRPTMGTARWAVWRSRCLQYFEPEQSVIRCDACHVPR